MFWGDGSQKFSDQDRIEQIQMGIPKILSHPWGYGVGRGAETLGFAPAGARSLTIDNYYLDVTLEYGIDGFIIYYGMFVAAMYYCVKIILRLKPMAREIEMLLPLCISLATFFIIKSSVPARRTAIRWCS